MKELCIQHFKNKFFLHSTYHPPTYFHNQDYSSRYARSNRWTVYNHHQLSVSEGVRPYNYIFVDLERMLKNCTNGETLIYVAGTEKMHLLVNLLCGLENSKKVPNLVLPKDILIFDIANNKANKKLSSIDYFNLSLNSTAQDRRKYLIAKYMTGQHACLFHTSHNCARLNCLYLLDKFYAALHNTLETVAAPSNNVLPTTWTDSLDSESEDV